MFSQVTELAKAGSLGLQERTDYHLSRYAAYLSPNSPIRVSWVPRLECHR